MREMRNEWETFALKRFYFHMFIFSLYETLFSTKEEKLIDKLKSQNLQQSRLNEEQIKELR